MALPTQVAAVALQLGGVLHAERTAPPPDVRRGRVHSQRQVHAPGRGLSAAALLSEPSRGHVIAQGG